MNEGKLAVRVNPENFNHHLWQNNGTWWCHFTVHLANFTKQRVRRSLKTCDLVQARERRDALLTQAIPGVAIGG
jgi:hypothetical protein